MSARAKAGIRQTLARLGIDDPILRAYHRVRGRGEDDALRELLRRCLAPDSCCIDVGCHRGAVLREIIRVAPRGRHIAFEPLPHFNRGLRRRFPQVEVRMAALSDQAGQAEFVHVRSRPAFSGLRRQAVTAGDEVETLSVRVERLDDVLPPRYVPRLIKIDVEGNELRVLQGARETLRRHRPIVVLEHGRAALEDYASRPESIHDLLAGEVGLTVSRLGNPAPLDRERFAAVVREGSHWEFVARPSP